MICLVYESKTKTRNFDEAFLQSRFFEGKVLHLFLYHPCVCIYYRKPLIRSPILIMHFVYRHSKDIKTNAKNYMPTLIHCWRPLTSPSGKTHFFTENVLWKKILLVKFSVTLHRTSLWTGVWYCVTKSHLKNEAFWEIWTKRCFLRKKCILFIIKCYQMNSNK